MEIIDLNNVAVAGRVYRYVGPRGGGTLYCVVGTATALHAWSKVVVYRGLDGNDRDSLWTTPLSDFALRFRLEPLPEPEPPSVEEPEKVAGHVPEPWRSGV